MGFRSRFRPALTAEFCRSKKDFIVSRKLKTPMIISIQTPTENCFRTWDDCPPVLHEVKDWQEAVTVARAIAKQFKIYEARVVQIPPAWVEELEEITTVQLINQSSGTYVRVDQNKLA
jgi:hypothetical protein